MQGVPQAQFSKFDASSYRVGIVAAEFNSEICDALLENALAAAEACGIKRDMIIVYRVPGSVEIPVILRALAEKKPYDCLVAIGCVVRGETPHFDYVAKIVAEGVLEVTMRYGIPVGFGVLTCDTQEQAKARLHAGEGAMQAALQCAKIIKGL